VESREPRKGWFGKLWDKMTESSLHKIVAELAPAYFGTFGYEDARREYNGIQVRIFTQYCEVSFWDYKWDVGSAIKPRSGEYESKIVCEVPVHAKLAVRSAHLRTEIERQMKLIVERYRPALEGKFSGWPERS